MPEKSVREMNAFERRHYSLEARVFHALVMHSAILGFVCFIIGLGMYLNASVQDSMEHIHELARESLADAAQETDPEKYAARTMDILSQSSLTEKDGDAYFEQFEEISADPGYQRMTEILLGHRTEELYEFFFLAADEKAGRLVIVSDLDPRPDHAYRAGKQLRVPGWVQRLFFRKRNGGFSSTYYYWPGSGVICASAASIKEGDPSAGVLLAVTLVQDAVSGVRNFVLQYVIAVTAVVFVVGFFMTRHLKKTLVKPINDIADAAQEYVRDRREGRGESDHFSVLNIRTGDEVENLSLVMADMERDLAEYEDNLTRITAEKERISTELSLATRIQADMLPNIYPAFPDRQEFDIYASMNPAREVGGDFYDYFLIDDDHLCLVMADVSGKGVPAALFMMASRIILANNAKMGKSPSVILKDTNEAICSNNREEMFVTVWLGILEISTGTLTAANAGHEYPVMMQAGGSFKLVKDRHGFVIGGMDGMVYREYTLKMQPGSRLFLYTDGVPEAADADDAMFGTERMLAALNSVPDGSPREILGAVGEAVDAFVKDAEQFDDLTMLCVEYRGTDL